MTPERWQRIEELLYSAAKLEEKHRADFLKQACNSHEALRSEVETLLSRNKQRRLVKPRAGGGS